MPDKKHRKKFNTKRYLKIFATYFLLFTALFGMIDYYIYMEFNFLYFIILAILIAALITWIYVKKGKKDHVDDVANEIF